MWFNIRYEVKNYTRRKSGRILPNYNKVIKIYDQGLVFTIYKDDGMWQCWLKAGCLNVNCVDQDSLKYKAIFSGKTYQPLSLKEVLYKVKDFIDNDEYGKYRRFLRNYHGVAESIEE